MLIIKSRRSCWAIVLLDGSPKSKASCNCVVAVGCECLSSSGGSATFVSARRIFSTCHLVVEHFSWPGTSVKRKKKSIRQKNIGCATGSPRKYSRLRLIVR